MPIHNWAHAPSGLFHHFHQQWAGELCDSLNAGVLPRGFFALIDLRTQGIVPDVLTLGRSADDRLGDGGGTAVAMQPPKTRVVSKESDAEVYAARANRIAVRNADGELIAMIEIVSPGNKHNRAAIKDFVRKSTRLLRQGVHLLVVDLFPPTKRDPKGLHKLIWDQFRDESYDLPTGKPLTLASYMAISPRAAYVENVGINDSLPTMPIFLDSELHVPAPLEDSYMTTWQKCPPEFRETVERRIAAGS